MFNHTNQNVQTFNSSQFGELRVNLSDDGKIWFCLSDVCLSLGLGNASQTKSRLKAEGITANDTPTKSGMQQMLFIDEPNLYRCVFQSRKQEAEKFQDWVCEEVLPSIRKSGGYIAAKQDESPEVIMARALQIANETIERNKQQLQIAQGTIDRQAEQLRISAPKVAYVDEVLQSQNTYNVNLIAKELGMSAETLNRKLKEMGVQYKQGGVWVLARKYQNRGYTKTRTSSYTRSDGSVGTSMLTVFTEKGRAFIHSLFLGK